ncbi:MAG: carboxypeptidase regulatory-like domain-containing protein, partial [Planctomycetes bacterium]|nr:carboxypeptidase regulatory-like domain-containing protein [Planctomycetota bacterium]
VFVWRGDLRVAHAGSDGPPARVRDPVVVRRSAQEPKAAPRVLRHGRVFDALGYLVVGAEVVPMERPATRTDSDGVFGLELAPSTCIDVRIRADGMQPAWVRASEGSPDVLAVTLLPKAPWDRVPTPLAALPNLRGEGVVRYADGKPVAHAFVTASGGTAWARTDDIGRFALPMTTSTTTLLAHVPDAGDGRGGLFGRGLPFTSERATGVVPVPEVVATAAVGLRGIVRDARGEPVVGLPVEVAGEPLSRVVETGAGGAFRIGGLAPGRYDVRPFAFRGAVGVPQAVTLADRTVDLDLQLVRTEEVRLRVVDERGAPVPGVFVAASVGGARRGVAQADAAGRAAVPVAPTTEFEVRLPVSYAPVELRRFEPEPATLVVAMP